MKPQSADIATSNRPQVEHTELGTHASRQAPNHSAFRRGGTPNISPIEEELHEKAHIDYTTVAIVRNTPNAARSQDDSPVASHEYDGEQR